jgi:hypothetical protein
MLRHGRLAELERISDLADRSLVARDELEDVPTPGLGDGVERIRRG